MDTGIPLGWLLRQLFFDDTRHPDAIPSTKSLAHLFVALENGVHNSEPTFLVGLSVTDGVGSWRIDLEGTQWKASWTGVGRPRTNPEKIRAMRTSFERAKSEARVLRRELRELNAANKSYDRKRRSALVRDHLATSRLVLARGLEPSDESDAAVVVFRVPIAVTTSILWDDFSKGVFTPRELALEHVSTRFGLSAVTIANHLKSSPKRSGVNRVQRSRRRSSKT